MLLFICLSIHAQWHSFLSLRSAQFCLWHWVLRFVFRSLTAGEEDGVLHLLAYATRADAFYIGHSRYPDHPNFVKTLEAGLQDVIIIGSATLWPPEDVQVI